MRALFDVNVLIALLDAAHQHHGTAWAWLDANIADGWASSPITQNGYLRVVAQPAYPNPASIFEAAQRLRAATQTEHHEFWPDSLSLLDEQAVDAARIHGSRSVTDHYLLALAVHHGGRLVSFDRGIHLHAVRAAKSEHLIVL